MVKKISVVIGASYGDEGKGLVTDAITNIDESTLNVLTNGGAQRGHTVVTPDGVRHVFHHFGSGTFKGAITYFPSSFIVNPIIFKKEMQELISCEEQIIKKRGLSYDPENSKYFRLNLNPLISDDCLVTTPWDMLVNRIVSEEITGTNTCGMGVWETIVRNRLDFHATFEEFNLALECEGNEFLYEIREWCAKRLKDFYGLDIPEKYKDDFYSMELINHFASDFNYLYDSTRRVGKQFPTKYEHVVFENAQGLLLSNSYRRNSNYLTPSYTGAESVIPYINEILLANDIELTGKIIGRVFNPSVDIYYVSRPYITRHGKDHETFKSSKAVNPDMNIFDMTNHPNDYQGEIGYKPFDIYGLMGLSARIQEDYDKFKSCSSGCEINKNLVLTHTNEIYHMQMWRDYLACKGRLDHNPYRISEFSKMYYSNKEYGMTSCSGLEYDKDWTIPYLANVFKANHIF